MASDDVGLSPVSFVHDNPEYKTPSEWYENGPITCFWGSNYRPSKAVP